MSRFLEHRGRNRPPLTPLVLLLFFVPVLNAASPVPSQDPQAPASISIASFNIRVFSDRSRDDKELMTICELIAPYDLVSLQETRDLRVLERTVHMLKGRFGLNFGIVSAPAVGRGGPEIYAWLYRTDRLTAIGPVLMYPDPGDFFIREPAVQGFATRFGAQDKTGGFDFAIVNIHAIYGDNRTVRRAEASRLPEIMRWVTTVAVARIFGTATKEADVLLMGDFNLPSTDAAFDGLRTTGRSAVNPEARGTTIADNSYDNIWFDPIATKEYVGLWGIERFDETMFDGDDRAASLAVSDHRPIWARFSAGPDDD